jgi:hypothetical protein
LNFTGLASGTFQTFPAGGRLEDHTFEDTPFTARFTFLTDVGVVQTIGPDSYRLDYGFVNARLVISDLGVNRVLFGLPGNRSVPLPVNGTLFWTGDNFSNVRASAADDGTFMLGASSDFGSFTIGSCFAPCGHFTSLDYSVSVTPWQFASPVPGPLAGAGIPGLILACGGLLGWMRRRNKKEPPSLEG